MKRSLLFDEPKLCPRCPRIPFLNQVRLKSYTRTPALETNVKLCAKLRSLQLPSAFKCPHFPKTEQINGWLGPTLFMRRLKWKKRAKTRR